MKKQNLFKGIIALAIMVCSFTVYAESYDIAVGFTEITSENAGNVTGPEIISGKVSYDAASNTLTLDNAIINDGIEANNKDLVILIKGNVKAHYIGYYNYECNSAKIKGLPGSWLGLNHSLNNITLTHMLKPFTLTLENVTGTFSSKFPINGAAGNESVKMVNCNLTLDGNTENHPILKDIDSFSTEGCSILYPEGAVFNPTTKRLELNGQEVMGVTFIGTSKENFLPIHIAGSFITSPKMSSTNALSIQSGEISYDKQRNTLLLDNVKIAKACCESAELYSAQKDLTVEVKGDVSIPYFEFAENAVVKGLPESNLTLYDPDEPSILLRDCGVILKNVSGGFYKGICGQSGAGTETCTLDSCKFWFNTENSGRAPISNLSGLAFKNCGIRSPNNGFYSGGRIYDGKGSEYTGAVEIAYSTYYGINFCGIDIDQYNKRNMIGTACTGFQAEYLPEDKLLLLGEIVVDKSKHPICLESQVSGLHVRCWGNNEISGLRLQSTFLESINGRLSMNLTEKEKGIVFSDSLLIQVSDGVFKAGGAIMGSNREKDVLVISGSNLTLDGLGQPTISGISRLNLRGCDIVSPAGAAFDPELGGVALNGELVTSEIVIKQRDYIGYGILFGKYPLAEDNIDSFNASLKGTGSLEYDIRTKTLIIDNVKKAELLQINATGEIQPAGTGDPVTVDCDSLNILIKNNVELERIDSNRKYVKIQGTPLSKLDVKTEDGASAGYFKELVLEEVNGVFSSVTIGIFVEDTLLIKKCNLEVNTKDIPVFVVSKDITIVDCFVIYPLGGVFKNGQIMLNEGGHKGKMIISTDAAGVENIVAEPDDDPNAPMYNVMGQRIDRPYHGQLYIQNGKKKVWFDR